VGFANEITGGQGALLRRAIKSPNYVPGVSGWSINKDGTAEFTSGQFRGAVLIGTSPNPRIFIGSDIPAPLVAASTDFTWSAAQIWYFNATEFYWQAIGTFNPGGFPIWAAGSYDTVNGVLFNEFEQGPGGGSPNILLYGSDTYNSTALSWFYRNGTMTWSDTVNFIWGSNFQIDKTGTNEITAGGLIRHEEPLGVMYTQAGTIMTTPGTGAETAQTAWNGNSSSTFDCVDGRIMRLECEFGFFDNNNEAYLLTVRLRKVLNNTGSTQLGFWRGVSPAIGAGLVNSGMGIAYVKNNTGSTVSFTPGFTVARNVGAGTVAAFGDANIPCRVTAYDAGSTANQGPLATVAIAL
jgi:hypothetical protein